MGKNFKAEGKTLDFLATADVASGDGVRVGANLFGVAAVTFKNGEVGVLDARGVFSLKKKTATAMNQGDIVDWDDGNSEVVPDGDAASDGPCGTVWKPALAGDANVEVKINQHQA